MADVVGINNRKARLNSKFNNIQGFTLSPVEHYNKYGVIFDLPAAFFEIIFKPLLVFCIINYIKLAYDMADFTVFFVSSVTFTKGSLTSSEDKFNKLAAYFTGLGLLSINKAL